MNAAVPFEVYPATANAVDRDNMAKRNRFFANVGRVAPIPAGDVLPKTGVLGPGGYPGGVVADGADISGVGLPELGPLTINGAATIRDCQLNGQLALGPGAAARLVGCNIQRPILVAAGGRLVVGASTFLTGQAFINNIGAAANCVSVGNVGWNPGPTPHVNTTIIGEV